MKMPETETVVHFCVKNFLRIMRENNDRHKDPYDAVVKALQKEYHIDRDSAYETVKPVYWHLMDSKILSYKGVNWTCNGRHADISDAVKNIIGLHGEDIEDMIERWDKI